MARKRPPLDPERQAQILETLRRDNEIRQKSYRERALRLFPHVCARCGRELAGKRLRELTVHHKDHDHKNNPPDGSNWELLCLYCHDHEHEKYKMAGFSEATPATDAPAEASPIYSPFEALDALIKPPATDEKSSGTDQPAPENTPDKPADGNAPQKPLAPNRPREE